jgi:hypothetical protein
LGLKCLSPGESVISNNVSYLAKPTKEANQ